MARGMGPGRAGLRALLARCLTGLDAVDFRRPLFFDPAPGVLERAVPGEDPRDLVDVRDAIYPRLPRNAENPSSHNCPACHT
jgi:hypothetical protein